MKTFNKLIAAIIMASIMMLVLAWRGASFNAVAAVFVCGALMLCALFGIFDGEPSARHDNIKHRTGAREAA